MYSQRYLVLLGFLRLHRRNVCQDVQVFSDLQHYILSQWYQEIFE